MVDQHLVWEEDKTFLQGKISRALGFLKYAKKFLQMQTLNLIYKGIIEPHFKYRCFLQGCCGESRKEALEKLQNCAARIVTNSSYNLAASTLLGILKWPSINEIINVETVTMFYKSLMVLRLIISPISLQQILLGKEYSYEIQILIYTFHL